MMEYNLILLKAMHSEKEIIFIARESPEGGYEAHSPGYSIYTQADNFEELRAMVHDAVSCHFEEDERPGIIRLHQVLQPEDE